jgi:tetratricopeptide (TPR) repeat protein
MEDFQKAIELNSNQEAAYIGLAESHRLNGDPKTAIENFSIVLGSNNSDIEIIGLKRAICYIELKNYKLAEKDLNQVKKIPLRF